MNSKRKGAAEKEQIVCAYTSWIQETSKVAKKELEKHGVTNWVHGQRSRQFGIAGHVMRKQDGRWSKALIQFEEGKNTTQGRPLINWDHDIRSWFHKRYSNDHRPWQDIAMNPNEWTALRLIYAAEWQNNRYTKDIKSDQYH